MCNFTELASFSLGHCHFYVHSTKELMKRRLIQNFNIPAGATPRVFELLKIGSFKFPPPFLPLPPRTKLRSNFSLKHNSLFNNSLNVQQMLKETTVKSRSSRLECIHVSTASQ